MAPAPPTRYRTLSRQPPNGASLPGRITEGLTDNRRDHRSSPSNNGTGEPSANATPSPPHATSIQLVKSPWPPAPMGLSVPVPCHSHCVQLLAASCCGSSTSSLALVPAGHHPSAQASTTSTALTSILAPDALAIPNEADPFSPDPLAIERDGTSYLFPQQNVVIHFLSRGERPCDRPGPCTVPFAFEKLRAPCSMLVRELVRRLRDRAATKTGQVIHAVQVMDKVATDNHHEYFQVGMSLAMTGDRSDSTLLALGWDVRGEEDPVYLVVVW